MTAGDGVQRVREALLEHDCRPRGSNLKLRARCPVHGSNGPTLAVSQGRAGAVIYCHAHCETVDVLAAIGLTLPDLYDEPREAGHQWSPRPVTRSLSSAEQVAQVVARTITLLETAKAMERTTVLRPRLTPGERVEQAEWACQEEARLHFERTMARYAALATDERYVRAAYRQEAAWLARRGPQSDEIKPSHEQHVVLMFRRADIERDGGARVLTLAGAR